MLYGLKSEESVCLVSLSINRRFVVKRLLNLKKMSQETARWVKKKNKQTNKKTNCFHWGTFGDRTSAYGGAKVQSRFYQGDLVTRTGHRETRSESGRLSDYPGELACMQSFKGEDTVLIHLRFDFHGLVRLLQGLRLHFLPSSTACSKILLDFFSVCVLICFCVFIFCLLVVCFCLNFVGFF